MALDKRMGPPRLQGRKVALPPFERRVGLLGETLVHAAGPVVVENGAPRVRRVDGDFLFSYFDGFISLDAEVISALLRGRVVV